MIRSNFSELRRVRHEMSREVGNDLRRYAATLAEVRERVASRLVNHGAESRTNANNGAAQTVVSDGESSPAAR